MGKKLKDIEFIRTQSNEQINTIIRIITKMEKGGFKPLPGGENDKKNCLQVLKERGL